MVVTLEITKEGDTYIIEGMVMTEGPFHETADTKEEAEKILRPMLITYNRLNYQMFIEDVTKEFTELILEIDKAPHIINFGPESNE